MSILEVEAVHTYYGSSHVLHGLDMRIDQGQIVAVLGRNGAGKTTLVHSIIGFNPIRSGRIHFKDEDISHQPTHLIARKGIGLIPQGRRIFPSLTVEENLAIAVRAGETSEWSVGRVLSLFENLRSRLQSRAGDLSGGEQQMLACGRALVGNPDLIILDEPSEGLAPLMIRELAGAIREMKAHGHSVLLVEQNLPFALGLADYVYVMNRGVVVHESRPEEVMQNAEMAKQYLGV